MGRQHWRVAITLPSLSFDDPTTAAHLGATSPNVRGFHRGTTETLADAAVIGVLPNKDKRGLRRGA
jgi:hypothetical protein